MKNKNVYKQLIAECESETTRYLEIHENGPIAVIKLNDPKNYNSLSPALCYQLRKAVARICDTPEIRVLILTGEDPAFCSGGDLELIKRCESFIDEGDEGAATVWRWIRQQFGGIARTLTQSDTYCVAAINGPAAGVGLSFAFACDYLIASDKAKLVLAFSKIGLIPEVGSNWHLTRTLGYHKAMELFISGQTLGAREAQDLGLVNQCVPHSKLMQEAHQWAQEVCSLPDSVVSMAKTQMRKIGDMTWDQAIVMEEFAEPVCFTTEGHRQAVENLLAGRRR